VPRRVCGAAEAVREALRGPASVGAGAVLTACDSSVRPAHAAKPGARYYEQRRAKRELRGALHPDEHRPPPVCMRFPPEGPRIVAVVLGRQNLQRVKAAFRSLRLKALFQVGSTAVYEAHLASIYRRVSSAKPHSYGNLKVFWKGFGFTKPLNPQEEISFEPICPRVQIGIHAKDPEREPAPETRLDDSDGAPLRLGLREHLLRSVGHAPLATRAGATKARPRFSATANCEKIVRSA
jgi:hypothetical protein